MYCDKITQRKECWLVIYLKEMRLFVEYQLDKIQRPKNTKKTKLRNKSRECNAIDRT